MDWRQCPQRRGDLWYTPHSHPTLTLTAICMDTHIYTRNIVNIPFTCYTLARADLCKLLGVSDSVLGILDAEIQFRKSFKIDDMDLACLSYLKLTAVRLIAPGMIKIL